MMTTREDPTKRDLPSTASATESATKGEPAKKLDPWHFGAHTVPPNLRAELSNIELPDAPAERRYRPQAPAVEQAEATEELRIPKRDFRRSVTVGLGLLVLVVGAAAVFRCSASESQNAPPSVSQSAPKPPRVEAVAAPIVSPIGEVAPQPSPLAAASSGGAAASSASSKPAGGKEKPRTVGAAPSPASGLEVSPSLPNPQSPEAPASSGKKLVLEPR